MTAGHPTRNLSAKSPSRVEISLAEPAEIGIPAAGEGRQSRGRGDQARLPTSSVPRRRGGLVAKLEEAALLYRSADIERWRRPVGARRSAVRAPATSGEIGRSPSTWTTTTDRASTAWNCTNASASLALATTLKSIAATNATLAPAAFRISPCRSDVRFVEITNSA